MIVHQSLVTSRAQRTLANPTAAAGESSEVHRGGSPDSSTVNNISDRSAPRTDAVLPLPGCVSLPSPTFFNYKDHIRGLCLEGKVGGRQPLSAQMMTQSLFVCSLTRSHHQLHLPLREGRWLLEPSSMQCSTSPSPQGSLRGILALF